LIDKFSTLSSLIIGSEVKKCPGNGVWRNENRRHLKTVSTFLITQSFANVAAAENVKRLSYSAMVHLTFQPSLLEKLAKLHYF
jgi:hypothetical protein